MATNTQRAVLVGGGAAALFLLMRKKAAAAPVQEPVVEEPPREETLEEVLLRMESPDGRAHLGKLYAIQDGDTPLEVMREALFGTRAPVSEAWKRKAAKDLLVRTECSPWNQANYARGPEDLRPDHAALVRKRHNQRGISFRPIYSNNRARMMLGDQPTSESGTYLAYIWIPNIDIDHFDQTNEVTLLGMDWPDTEDGPGHSMIDPPWRIVRIGFADITNSSVGCEFPEGDFRRFVVST